MLQRISEVIDPQSKPNTLLSIFQESDSIGDVVTHFDTVLPKSQAEVSVVKQRLIRAGIARSSTIRIFYGMQFHLSFSASSALVSGLRT